MRSYVGILFVHGLQKCNPQEGRWVFGAMQKSTLFLGYIFVTRIGSGRQYYCASSVSLGYIFVTRNVVE